MGPSLVDAVHCGYSNRDWTCSPKMGALYKTENFNESPKRTRYPTHLHLLVSVSYIFPLAHTSQSLPHCHTKPLQISLSLVVVEFQSWSTLQRALSSWRARGFSGARTCTHWTCFSWLLMSPPWKTQAVYTWRGEEGEHLQKWKLVQVVLPLTLIYLSPHIPPKQETYAYSCG